MILSRLRAKLDRPQVIQGMKLGTLIAALARNGFQVDAACLGRLAYLLGFGVFNSILAAFETVLDGSEIDRAEIAAPPLFVLGHWRSGTTHLHNLLSLDENLAYPNAYQALFPHHFVFSQVGGSLFNFIAPATRPMDNVAFAADLPHEDEFALAAASGVSPYLRVLFPVTGDPDASPFDPDRLPPWAALRWREAFLRFLKKVTFSEGNRRLALKSPPHMGRLKLLLDIFPDAQFVHIVRDPYMVYVSTRKLWRDSFGHAWLQDPGPEALDEMILSWHTELFDLYNRDRGLIPEGALCEIRYEDLESRPVECLSGVYEALGLDGFEAFSVRVRAYLDSLAAFRKNVHSLDEAARRKVAQRWGKVFEQYGYDF